uniref:Uncharacterized protein n=1 Tax=Glossina palpalis gambiensis TaxID=67801 RepID=A0A1B0BI18_9MUSC
MDYENRDEMRRYNESDGDNSYHHSNEKVCNNLAETRITFTEKLRILSRKRNPVRTCVNYEEDEDEPKTIKYKSTECGAKEVEVESRSGK